MLLPLHTHAHLLMRPSSSLSRTWKAMLMAWWLTGRLANLTPEPTCGSLLPLWLLGAAARWRVVTRVLGLPGCTTCTYGQMTWYLMVSRIWLLWLSVVSCARPVWHAMVQQKRAHVASAAWCRPHELYCELDIPFEVVKGVL